MSKASQTTLKILKIIGTALLAIIAICLLILCLSLCLIRTDVGSKLTSDIATKEINGSVKIGHLDYKLFSTYPLVSIELNNVDVRSDALNKGDSLCSFKRLTATIDLKKLLDYTDIDVKSIELEGANIVGIMKKNGQANWNIIKNTTKEKDTTTTKIPTIHIQNLKITNSNIRFADDKDGQYANIKGLDIHTRAFVDINKKYDIGLILKMASANYHDKNSTYNICAQNIQIETNTQINSTSKGSDKSYAINLILKIEKGKYADNQALRNIKLNGLALNTKALINNGRYAINTLLETKAANYKERSLSVGPIPIHLYAKADCDTSLTNFNIDKLNLGIRDIVLFAQGSAKTFKGNWNTNLNYDFASKDLQQVNEIIPTTFARNIPKMDLGGSLGIKGTIKGDYTGNIYPTAIAQVDLNNSWVHFKGRQGRIGADMHAKLCVNTKNKSKSFVNLKKLAINAGPTNIHAQGSVKSALKDPTVNAQANCNLNLDMLAKMIPAIKGMVLSGGLKSSITTDFKMSDIKKRHLKNVHAHSNINVSRIKVKLPSQGIYVLSKNTNVEAGINTIRTKKLKQLRFFIAKMEMDFMNLQYGKIVNATASKFNVNAQADKLMSGIPLLKISAEFNGLKGIFNDTTSTIGKHGKISMSIRQDTLDPLIPLLKGSIKMDSMMYFTPTFGGLIDSTRLNINVKPKVRKHKRVNGVRVDILPSERKRVNIDSLQRIFGKIQKSEDPSNDVLKEFQFTGKAYIKLARYASPFLPLRTSIKKLDMSFSDDTLTLKNAKLKMGRSSVNLSGKIKNIRRAIVRGKVLTADFTAKGKRIDCNQLLHGLYEGEQAKKRYRLFHRAMSQGLIQKPDKTRVHRNVNVDMFAKQSAQKKRLEISAEKKAKMESLMKQMEQQENEEMEAKIDTTKIDSAAAFGLMCLPANYDIIFKTDIDTVKFSNLVMNQFQGNVMLKNSTLQLQNFKTNTNVGNLKINAMYHCKSQDVAQTGLDISGEKINIGDLVTTLPMLDSIVPMLRSFKGLVSCDISAVTDLDSMLNPMLPTLNTSCYIRGENLVLLDGETFSEVAKMLMFKKKTQNLINNISVEFFVKNNQMEVLPFMLKMDKYKVAVGGNNSLNMDFNYHISVLQSPLPFKLGVNVYGNFNKFKFRLESPKYKDEKTITKTGQFAKNSNIRQDLDAKLKEQVQNAINSYK